MSGVWLFYPSKVLGLWEVPSVLDMHRTVQTKSRKRTNASASDRSLKQTHWNTRVRWVKGAMRGWGCLKREEGKCVDLAGIPKPKRSCIHQEEIQSENKTHFRSLPTGAANTEGLNCSSPSLISANIYLVGRGLSFPGSPGAFAKCWDSTTKDATLKR